MRQCLSKPKARARRQGELQVTLHYPSLELECIRWSNSILSHPIFDELRAWPHMASLDLVGVTKVSLCAERHMPCPICRVNSIILLRLQYHACTLLQWMSVRMLIGSSPSNFHPQLGCIAMTMFLGQATSNNFCCHFFPRTLNPIMSGYTA